MNSQRRWLQRLGATFRPRLERLESRDCPSCTVFQKGDTLSILGDREANHIAIADTRDGGISVVCDRGTPQTFFGVNQIDLNTFAGDDEITGVFIDPPDNFRFRADLGGGNDRLSIRGFDPQPDPPLRLISFDILAGAGDDEITATFTDPSDPDIQFRADLGAGDDASYVAFDPQPDPPTPALAIGAASAGRFQLDVRGGQGNDHIGLGIAAVREGQLRHFHTNLDVTFDGGAGDDQFVMNLSDVVIDGQIVMSTHGGAGNDGWMMDLADVTIDGRLLLSTDGGAGDDQWRMHLGDFYLNGALVMSTEGGAGDDDWLLSLGDNMLEGDFAIFTDGGAGNDRLQIDAILPCLEPEGQARFVLHGDAGDDRLGVLVDGAGDPDGPAEIEGTMRIDLGGGGGDDVATLDIPTLDIIGSVLVNFDGERGADRLLMRVAADVRVFGLLDISALGGAGNDLIESFIIPCVLPAGRGNFLFDGEAGDDRIAVRLEMDEDDTGTLDVRVLGGWGDDDLTLALYGVDNLSLLTALLDGGRGYDIARVTRNVRVGNCEEVLFLDEPR